ncbi:MAG: SDR family NAD(P)-dependent oxidoreductase [Nitriliruptoraceae bacterium]|nr:SDR family NAD(P)-dependent oxidoreductase [Nitriliruptoraceae bacterium]
MSSMVIVTGGSGGLGRALLRTAPRPGLRVDVSRSGPPPEADRHLAADLSRPEDWASVGQALRTVIRDEPWDELVVVHAAGTIDPIGFAGEVDDEAYQRSVLIGASGQVLGHHVLGALGDRAGAAQLVMVSSGAGGSVYAGWTSYGAGKAALDHWVRNAGEEQRQGSGARVLSIAPGTVATAMQSAVRDADPEGFPRIDKFRSLHEEGELADPDEAARAMWRIIDDASHPSGAVLDVRDH